MTKYWRRVQKAFKWKYWEYKLKVFDERLSGVDFSVSVPPEDLGLDPTTARKSSPSGNKWLRKVLSNLAITETDNILDVGCGKGSAMRVMLEFAFSRVDGIEISEDLAEIARHNFVTLGISSDRCNVYAIDARFFRDFHIYNLIYFYNPFSSEIMTEVIENLSSSIRQRPRKVKIIYNNPVCHFDILRTGRFRKVSEYPDEWGNGIIVYENLN